MKRRRQPHSFFPNQRVKRTAAFPPPLAPLFPFSSRHFLHPFGTAKSGKTHHKAFRRKWGSCDSRRSASMEFNLDARANGQQAEDQADDDTKTAWRQQSPQRQTAADAGQHRRLGQELARNPAALCASVGRRKVWANAENERKSNGENVDKKQAGRQNAHRFSPFAAASKKAAKRIIRRFAANGGAYTWRRIFPLFCKSVASLRKRHSAKPRQCTFLPHALRTSFPLPPWQRLRNLC